MRYMTDISRKISNIRKVLEEADYILVGAGAGLSTAAGINYAGDEFRKDFAEFIKKYYFTDLYTSSFYNFKTEEEKWAYWAKHIYFADTGREALDLYKKILKLIEKKPYFVITTNVDDQFFKAGFDKNKVFEIQGSYSKIQCSKACHDKLYDDTKIVEEMLKNIDEDLKIPTSLVPVCPVCGEEMNVNLRKDDYFVQDDEWYRLNDKYSEFVQEIKGKKVALLEFGVGFNTPGIIRFPFEKMTSENDNYTLIRFNKDHLRNWMDIDDKSILVSEDINIVIDKLLKNE